jgi:stage II sporulation protein D
VQRIGAEPDIRVGVAVRATEVRIDGRGDVAALASGRVVFRLRGSEGVAIVPDGRGIQVAGAATGRYESLTFTSLEDAKFVEVNGKAYRGVVEVFARNGGVMAVNQVSLEAYVAGVIAAEMGRRAPEEQAALEAQAVVSRTYALSNRGKFAVDGYDVDASVTDQAYGGVAAESRQAWDAVRSTAGLVLTYDGDVISAFFHSTCGGATASPEESFRTGQRTPYLTSVSDRSPAGYYCDISPRFRWTVEWDGATLTDILRRTLPRALGVEAEVVDAVHDVRIRKTGRSGRVTELRIRVGSGEVPVYGPDIRSVLAQPDGRILGSTAFESVSNHGTDGLLRRLSVRGSGWGHGVGMCQWGAVGRARAGQDFRRIVTTYFPGARIDRWY